MRIATFNTEYGGGDDERFRAQLDMINDVRPTVLFLQELKNWHQDYERRRLEFEDATNLRVWMARSNHHGAHVGVALPHGARVLEKRHETQPNLWHAVAHVKVSASRPEEPLHLMSCHLAPSSSLIRRAEAEALTVIKGPLLAHVLHLLSLRGSSCGTWPRISAHRQPSTGPHDGQALVTPARSWPHGSFHHVASQPHWSSLCQAVTHAWHSLHRRYGSANSM